MERMEEYKGKGKLDVVIIYACAPAVFEQVINNHILVWFISVAK